MEFLEKYSGPTDLDLNAIIAFVHEEASKILNRWHMIKIDKTFDLPEHVNQIFELSPNVYLSGGALVRENCSDYDFFLVGPDHDFIEKIRKMEDLSENSFCINLPFRKQKKIQIIKRFYNNPELIIGNFDLSIVRAYYRPGIYRVSILRLFEKKTGVMYINMKNNSKNFSFRIKKYGEIMNYYNVFDFKPLPIQKEKPYSEGNKISNDIRNIIHGKYQYVFTSSKCVSIERLLKRLTPENYSFHNIFKVRDFVGRINVRGEIYSYKPENCKKIVEFLLRKYYPEFLETLKFQPVKGYCGAIMPLPPKYKQHSGVNIFHIVPALLFIQKFPIPKFLRITITWHYTLLCMEDIINKN